MNSEPIPVKNSMPVMSTEAEIAGLPSATVNFEIRPTSTMM